MKNQAELLKLVFSLISIAFFAIFLDALGFLHPYGEIFAAVVLLAACFYIGKYGDLQPTKKRK